MQGETGLKQMQRSWAEFIASEKVTAELELVLSNDYFLWLVLFLFIIQLVKVVHLH